jgi:uncharacterized BrkB/YihY/UPF0761 family membrane protein
MSKTKFTEKDKSVAQKSPNTKTYGKHQEKPVVKERSKWYLSLAILLVLLSGIFFTFWVFTEKRILGLSFAEIPWWAWGILITNVVDIVAAVALWYWKKWGLWLYLASIVTRTVLIVVAGAFGTGFASFLPFAIVGYAVSLHWKHFE